MLDTLQGRKYARVKDVCDYFGIGRTSLWAWEQQYTDFPKPMRPSRRVTLFDIDALTEWFRNRPATHLSIRN